MPDDNANNGFLEQATKIFNTITSGIGNKVLSLKNDFNEDFSFRVNDNNTIWKYLFEVSIEVIYNYTIGIPFSMLYNLCKEIHVSNTELTFNNAIAIISILAGFMFISFLSISAIGVFFMCCLGWIHFLSKDLVSFLTIFGIKDTKLGAVTITPITKLIGFILGLFAGNIFFSWLLFLLMVFFVFLFMVSIILVIYRKNSNLLSFFAILIVSLLFSVLAYFLIAPYLLTVLYNFFTSSAVGIIGTFVLSFIFSYGYYLLARFVFKRFLAFSNYYRNYKDSKIDSITFADFFVVTPFLMFVFTLTAVFFTISTLNIGTYIIASVATSLPLGSIFPVEVQVALCFSALGSAILAIFGRFKIILLILNKFKAKVGGLNVPNIIKSNNLNKPFTV